jgi:hypothetical protein
VKFSRSGRCATWPSRRSHSRQRRRSRRPAAFLPLGVSGGIALRYCRTIAATGSRRMPTAPRSTANCPPLGNSLKLREAVGQGGWPGLQDHIQRPVALTNGYRSVIGRGRHSSSPQLLDRHGRSPGRWSGLLTPQLRITPTRRSGLANQRRISKPAAGTPDPVSGDRRPAVGTPPAIVAVRPPMRRTPSVIPIPIPSSAASSLVFSIVRRA